MRRISIGLALMTIMAGAAVAELSAPYTDWFKGPVQHLMTKDEMNRWKKIRSDEEAKAFIDLFWARRDPTPDTPRNEFREEFEARVDAADRHFSTPRATGSMTDLGRVLILLGPPSQVGSRGPEGRSRSAPNPAPGSGWDGAVDVPGARAEGARQVWTYSQARKPKFVKQKDLDIIFVDEGGNRWEIARTERLNPEPILQQVAAHYIVSPHLTKPPVFAELTPLRVTSFRNTALEEAYRQFRAEQKTAVGSAYLTWGEFVTPAGEGFVPVQLYVPAEAGIEAGREVTFFGVVENDAGKVVEIHENVATLSASGKDAYVEQSLRLEPGRYTATFGVAAEGRLLAMTRTEMTILGLDPSASGISPLILSNNIYALEEAYKPTDPFIFGGLKVVPKGDSLFSLKGDLWYFLELRNPGLTDQGAPKVQVKVDIDGKTKQGPVRMTFPLADAEIAKLKGTEDRYAVGMAIPLEGFEPGEYTMKIRVVDSILAKNYDFERKFRVRDL